MTTKWPWSQTPNDHKERFKRAKYGSLKISLKKTFQKPQKSWETINSIKHKDKIKAYDERLDPWPQKKRLLNVLEISTKEDLKIDFAIIFEK